jgi:hypothetical protein
VADAIRQARDVDVEVRHGWLGEFTVRLDRRVLARRRWFQLPPAESVVAAVRDALP